MMKFMCKNEFFQSLGMKNELFKVQGRNTKLMYSLEIKTIFLTFFFIEQSCTIKATFIVIRDKLEVIKLVNYRNFSYVQ
jgi:hypothetical protein